MPGRNGTCKLIRIQCFIFCTLPHCYLPDTYSSIGQWVLMGCNFSPLQGWSSISQWHRWQSWTLQSWSLQWYRALQLLSTPVVAQGEAPKKGFMILVLDISVYSSSPNLFVLCIVLVCTHCGSYLQWLISPLPPSVALWTPSLSFPCRGTETRPRLSFQHWGAVETTQPRRVCVGKVAYIQLDKSSALSCKMI